MLILYIASLLGILLLLMAVLAVAADTGASIILRAARGFVVLVGVLYFLIEGISAGGLQALADEPLLGESILALAAAAYSFIYVWIFVAGDPLARVFERQSRGSAV